MLPGHRARRTQAPGSSGWASTARLDIRRVQRERTIELGFQFAGGPPSLKPQTCRDRFGLRERAFRDVRRCADAEDLRPLVRTWFVRVEFLIEHLRSTGCCQAPSRERGIPRVGRIFEVGQPRLELAERVAVPIDKVVYEQIAPRVMLHAIRLLPSPGKQIADRNTAVVHDPQIPWRRQAGHVGATRWPQGGRGKLSHSFSEPRRLQRDAHVQEVMRKLVRDVGRLQILFERTEHDELFASPVLEKSLRAVLADERLVLSLRGERHDLEPCAAFVATVQKDLNEPRSRELHLSHQLSSGFGRQVRLQHEMIASQLTPRMGRRASAGRMFRWYGRGGAGACKEKAYAQRDGAHLDRQVTTYHIMSRFSSA